ncbi:ABC transporter ATP-binding protein [Paenibacillus sp. Leaf72]|uniref:ABC transporter ATP-binding protein n=1 Tax=Paenibacillus sp. Leaf72 TaxID=1736234 RepID=UPI0006F639D5|nr:ABC transporter ATP-binding protein [Paenibacillus sp. Leaf72]KQO17764.1 ABC transporter [Paenibacillus sp. Leaf72]
MSEQKQNSPQRPKGIGMGPPGMGMMMPPQKAKDFKGTLKRLAAYLKPHRTKLALVLLTAILSTVFSIVSPKMMGQATTKLYEGVMGIAQGVPGARIDFDAINTILLTLVVLYLISAAFGFIQQYLMAGVAQKTVYDLRKDVNNKFARLPLKFFDSRSNGEVLSRVVNDVDNISNTLQQSLTQLITSFITLVGVIVMMLTISPLLTLIVFLTIPASLLATKAIAKRSQKYFADQQAELGRLNGHVEEMYTGHKIVKAFGHERKSLDEFNEMNEKLYDSGWRAQFVSGIIMPIMSFISNIGYVLVCVIGGLLVTRNAIKIGDILAFIQYTRQFTMPITQLANIANIIQSTIASAERVFELLDEEDEVIEAKNAKAISKPSGAVRFEQVDFGYKANEPLISGMNIDVLPGQTVAIVGPTGAGKTTMINLLMRFYELNGGRITIDGEDITALQRRSLRRMFGMVLQDTWLFNGSIRDNIAYGREDATEEEVYQAARAAHADHFIRTLPDGYDTILNEEASNISQGQKQLLTIARAILADPSILILDEATSSVDTRTEIIIQRAMGELMKNRTSFVIAHRLSTIRGADLILVMNNGSIIEQGRHEALLEQGGFYADLYNSQFTGKRTISEVV